MNRTIKFRGKRIDNGEWVYGDLSHDYVNENGEISPTSIRYKLRGIYCTPVAVDPETVGQSTGLFDRNGKEIFESDIVRYELAGHGYRNGIVEWDKALTGFSPFCDTLCDAAQYCEVIGNKFEHQHLLKANPSSR